MDKKHTDLITIGDSTIDTFIRIHEATVECDINRQNCKICVEYGSKIPVDSIAFGVAGNAANVAVGASKLGLMSSIYTNLGDDEQGKTIGRAFTEAGVASDYVVTNKDKKSNLSVVLTFKGERTIFVYHQDWYYKLPKIADFSWVYLTSMSETFTSSNIVDDICHYLDSSGAKLVFSPGTYQLKADIKRYPRLLEKVYLIIVNMEESKRILGIDKAAKEDVANLLSGLLSLGPKIAVVTDGEEGSYASNGQNNLRLGILPFKVLERTGAGDAYASGLIAALFYEKPLEEAMVWGTINAANVIGQIGTQEGLLTLDEIEKHRKATVDFVATKF